MDIQEQIVQKLNTALAALGVGAPNAQLEYPAELAHGDFACNAALVYAKELGKNPRTFAEDIVVALGSVEGIAEITIAGPGFINFMLAFEAIRTTIAPSLVAPKKWGTGNTFKDQEIMVEYTDPNPFKEFHIGHLMSNTIGESVARLFASQGARVIRANYQGDVGIHVACALWGMQVLGIEPKDAERHGEAYAFGASAFKENPDVAPEIKSINKAVYEGVLEGKKSTWYSMYQAGRESSLARFEDIYALLGTEFDRYYFESVVGKTGAAIVLEHPDIFVLSDGARVFKGEEYGLHTRVFINNEGLPTYEAKELGLEKQKVDDYPTVTRLVVVTANEITEYFKVLTKAIGCVFPEVAYKLVHLAHGMMKLPTGKMSSRTGNVVTGLSLIRSLKNEARIRAADTRSDNPDLLAELLAVGAIKYQVLRQSIGKDIIFEESRALSLEGDSGPYVQYTHARCVSLLEKAGDAPVSLYAHTNHAPLLLERLLIRFPDIVARAARTLEPHGVAQYLLEVSSTFNAWYAQEHILDGTPAQAHKLALVQATRATLKNGLALLGITAPDKM